jgi:hypothetical protein
MQVMKEARDGLGDLAEKKLYDLIEAGDYRAIVFYLSTMCRDRGYTLPKGAALESNVTNNNLIVDTVNIVSVPSGRFLTAEDMSPVPQDRATRRLRSPGEITTLEP